MADDVPSLEWRTFPGEDVSDAIVAAMVEAGIEVLFFTSGAELVFYQEAIARALAAGRRAPRLITITHEHINLNAAIGYAAVSGKPAATAVHVDAGTLNQGGAIHTAWHSGVPVLMTAGGAPASYPGALPGGRDGGGHIWLQQTYDQHGIVRQYTKWDHRLDWQDNPGLVVGRAVQMAVTEPKGPVYLTIPKELALQPLAEARFPTLQQLGVAVPAAPDPAGIRALAARIVAAENPMMIVSGSGRNPKTVPALVDLCEFLGLPVVNSTPKTFLCFPMTHPLRQRASDIPAADLVFALEASVPWMPGPNEPRATAYIATCDLDPSRSRIPTYEFSAHLRLTGDSLIAIQMLTDAVHTIATDADRERFAARLARWTLHSSGRARAAERDAIGRATKSPIDPIWLTYQIAQAIGDTCTVFDDSQTLNRTDEFLKCDTPGTFFHNPGTSGGWGPGAALGAKIAAPSRDVVMISGDGYYMFASPNPAIWAASHYNAPFLSVIYQNRSYGTGTLRVAATYNDSHAARAGFEGGYFDPPIDFAMEASAAGALAENVRDPAEIAPALQRGLAAIRSGRPALISVWLPKLLANE